MAQNIVNGPFTQVLEISDAYFMDSSGFDGAEDDVMDTTPFRTEAAQQFQKAIQALQLTSLKLHDTDFMDVDSDPEFLSEHNVGNLTQLRCFLPQTKAAAACNFYNFGFELSNVWAWHENDNLSAPIWHRFTGVCC